MRQSVFTSVIAIIFFALFIVSLAAEQPIFMTMFLYIGVLLNACLVPYLAAFEHKEERRSKSLMEHVSKGLSFVLVLFFFASCASPEVPAEKVGTCVPYITSEVPLSGNELGYVYTMAEENGFCEAYVRDREPDGTLVIVDENGEEYGLKL